MQLRNIIEHIKMFIIDQYNKLISCIKNLVNKKPKINNQTTDQEIHIVKARVKKIGNKKLKTNL